ncbi:MAG: 1,6-anhydro-N-acetylmuramyl-L-alanine amidase AmpD [Gammaproteobacteria bacterium]|jgi:AmpD protein
MQIDPATHLLRQADYIPSPNMDDRPAGADINLLVIHSISLPPGKYGGNFITQLFTNSLPADAHPYFEQIHQLQVSAHALIRRDGSIIQFVPFNKRAWHAGDSCYRGKERCNDFSIGVELEGTDTDTFEDSQYEALVELVKTLCKRYPLITTQRIAGHSDIAPGRKTDPGSGFDWDKLSSLLA